MRNWLRRLRGAIGMGFTWAIGWFMVGGVIELIQNVVPGWNGAIVDIWPAALAYPAFIGGVVFSGVLAVAGRNRRFDEMSVPRFALWGALGGLLVGFVPATMVLLGLASVNPPATVLGITAVIAPLFAVLCSTSASGSLMLARMAEDRDLIAAGDDVADVGLTEAERAELLGEG